VATGWPPLLHFPDRFLDGSIMHIIARITRLKSLRLSTWLSQRGSTAAAASAPAVAALTLSIFAGPLLAQSPPVPLVNPGQWQITPQGSAGASVSYGLCFPRGDLEDLKQLLPSLGNTAECPPQRTEAANGVMNWEFNCPAKSFRGDGRYLLSATAVEGTINFTQGAPAVTATQRIVARHAGLCQTR
jgi:hypothetical protein